VVAAVKVTGEVVQIESLKITWAKRACVWAAGGIRLFLVFRVGSGGRVVLGSPAVAAGEDVFDALVGGQLARLSIPRRSEGATVEILHFCSVSGF
jgi:hypothetical protein